tara:strand:+ start:3413 stop:4573 length:1161 start_codon:yes stop_codon:yes gene_type:complete
LKSTNQNNFGFGTQIRKSPFFDATLKSGAKGFSVYNHMYIPRDFGDPVGNFWNLVNAAILCDVGSERQVEITGPDAARFVQYLTPRNLSKCAVGQCKYVILTDESGGILNDPVLLRLGENHFWFSLADSDVLFWVKGVAINSKMDVQISEPDVSPLQLQGPRSREIMEAFLGKEVSELRYYWLKEVNFCGIPLLVSRTGWSSELGYEIFLRDGSKGTKLWNTIMEIGKSFGLQAGHTSTIRRIEGGMLSYHADANLHTNPYELGLDRLIDLDMESDFIGKNALRSIREKGVTRILVGLILDCEPLPWPNKDFWSVTKNNKNVGVITSAVYSPRLKQNIALAILDLKFSKIGTIVHVQIEDIFLRAVVTEIPFFDPEKTIAKEKIIK